MKFSLHPRDPALHRFLTAPSTLSEDPTWRLLTERIEKARAAHQSTRGLEQARSEYLHTLLRGAVR